MVRRPTMVWNASGSTPGNDRTPPGPWVYPTEIGVPEASCFSPMPNWRAFHWLRRGPSSLTRASSRAVPSMIPPSTAGKPKWCYSYLLIRRHPGQGQEVLHIGTRRVRLVLDRLAGDGGRLVIVDDVRVALGGPVAGRGTVAWRQEGGDLLVVAFLDRGDGSLDRGEPGLEAGDLVEGRLDAGHRAHDLLELLADIYPVEHEFGRFGSRTAVAGRRGRGIRLRAIVAVAGVTIAGLVPDVGLFEHLGPPLCVLDDARGEVLAKHLLEEGGLPFV